MSRTTLDLWVGIFVAAGFAALVFLAVKVGSYSGSSGPTYAVSAEFDNIGGLKVRAPVKSAGVVVGRVGGIGFDEKTFRAVVRLDLDGQFEFPADTSASILTSGLLGEQYIGLDAGGDETNLKDGDKLQITQSAVVLEKLIGQFLFNKAAETPATAK
ncbi:MAG: outer membrane lipid asymmetry maintenance protein MlaD [Azoarcus sp.]|jgi:phospholipid/cholesterol/gamma-HCH transport system substrate-binding protein|nr:outer membrane lipid asymmetry maintenance protein MlaD [Azoarcus sp.]